MSIYIHIYICLIEKDVINTLHMTLLTHPSRKNHFRQMKVADV